METRSVLSRSLAVLGILALLLATRPVYSQSPQLEAAKPRRWELGFRLVPSLQRTVDLGGGRQTAKFSTGATWTASCNLTRSLYLIGGLKYGAGGGRWEVPKHVQDADTFILVLRHHSYLQKYLCLSIGAGFSVPISERLEFRTEAQVMGGSALGYRTRAVYDEGYSTIYSRSAGSLFLDRVSYGTVSAGIRAKMLDRLSLEAMSIWEVQMARYSPQMGFGVQVGAFWAL